MPTPNTVKADVLVDSPEVGGGDCQSEQGGIQFLRICGPELDKRYHFGEQNLSTSSPLWKVLPVRQYRVGEIKSSLTGYCATL